MTDLERRALAIWQAREMGFPAFVRRMKPDAWDRMSGAWGAVLRQAATEGGTVVPTPRVTGSLLRGSQPRVATMAKGPDEVEAQSPQ